MTTSGHFADTDYGPKLTDTQLAVACADTQKLQWNAAWLFADFFNPSLKMYT